MDTVRVEQQEWSYGVMHVHEAWSAEELMAELDRRGDDCWELVSLEGTRAVFKRPRLARLDISFGRKKRGG